MIMIAFILFIYIGLIVVDRNSIDSSDWEYRLSRYSPRKNKGKLNKPSLSYTLVLL